MAVPVISLNLAPRPNLWRQHHLVLGWLALAAGLAMLLGVMGLTWRAYHQASRAGREAVSLTEEARRASLKEQQIQTSLQEMDATREQSRWKLAERILMERALPWSRLTAELEQSMVPDMRLKIVQRTRSSGQQVVMKLKGEAQTRAAEAAFVEALQGTPVFTEVVLEREAERPGGGWEFELSLPTAAVPPPFHLLTKPRSAPSVIRVAAPPAAKGPTPHPPSVAANQGRVTSTAPSSSPAPIMKSLPPPVIQAQPAPDMLRPSPARSGPARQRRQKRSDPEQNSGDSQ